MNKFYKLLTLCTFCAITLGREPFKPRKGSLPFTVYFPSRYRGICFGFLVSRSAVMTAAMCVADPTSEIPDNRPINVITSVDYRHPRQGIRVQVTKILIPSFNNYTSQKPSLFQMTCAILLLKNKVPETLATIPLRALETDLKGEEYLSVQEECVIPGWHFFYRDDVIYPIHKFLLQRNLRVQFMNIVQKDPGCQTLLTKYQKALQTLGFIGTYTSDFHICLRDPDRTAQPCHGMYGAPLICKGRAVGIFTAPDAQWTNCTGFTSIFHRFNLPHQTKFLDCVGKFFAPDMKVNMEEMKKDFIDEEQELYDYIPPVLDRMYDHVSTSNEE